MRANDFNRSFGAVLAEARHRLGERPSTAKLLAYHRGELPAAQAEKVREHLAADPTLALHLLDLAADPTATDVHADLLSAKEKAEDLRKIQQKIRTDPETAEHTAVDERTRPPSAILEKLAAWFRPGQLPAFAAGMAVAFMTCGLYVQHRLSLPVPNVPQTYLDSSPQRGGGGRNPDAVLMGENGASVAFEVPGKLAFTDYRLEIRPAASTGESLLVSDLVPVDGLFTVLVRPGSLAVGEEYVIELFGVNGDDVQRLDSYRVIVQGAAADK